MNRPLEKPGACRRRLALAAVAGGIVLPLAGCSSSPSPPPPPEKVKALEAELDPSQIKKKRAKGKGEDYISLRQRKKLMSEAAKKHEGEE